MDLADTPGCIDIGCVGCRLNSRRCHRRTRTEERSIDVDSIGTVTLARPKTALIADDHLLVRSGVRLILESLGFRVLAEAGDGQQLVDLHALHRPGYLVVDVTMPVKSGLQAIAEIRRTDADVRALVVSNLESVDAIHVAFANGANAYLVKDFALPELEQALAATERGERYLSARLTPLMLAGLGGAKAPAPTLTPRQIEILRLIALGSTNKEAARTLGISPKTVDFHRQDIMRRLDVHDVAGLTRHAIRLGLLADDARA